MKNNIISVLLVVAASLMFNACLKSDDSDVAYYGDTAITAFSLGTLNRTLHTTSSTGEDSTYTSTVTGSNYLFEIDHYNGLIYNTDSLPVGTDASAVLVTLSTKNSGVVVIMDEDNTAAEAYYSSSDSIDFSSPRYFRVYAQNGAGYREYKVSVNVHQQVADSVHWTQLSTNSTFASMTAMRSLCMNDDIYLFGVVGGSSVGYVTPVSDGNKWSALSSSVSLDGDAWKNVITQGDYFFVKSGNGIYRSGDAQNWEAIAENSAVKQLIGASTTELYALGTEGGLLVSKDNGVTWSQDILGDTQELLPTQDISYVCNPLSFYENLDRIVVVGNRDASVGDSTAVVWSKMIEYSEGADPGVWYAVEKVEDNRDNFLPKMQSMVAVPYDNGILAFGGDGMYADSAAFSHIYQSFDNGLSWEKDDDYQFPAAFSSSKTVFAATSDSNNFVWVICGGTGQVWRFRANRLGWKED